jgi:hypothetical protein
LPRDRESLSGALSWPLRNAARQWQGLLLAHSTELQ